MDIRRVHSDEHRRELRAQHLEVIRDLLLRIAGRGIDVAQPDDAVRGGDAHHRALLHRLGEVRVLVFPDQRHCDSEYFDSFYPHIPLILALPPAGGEEIFP